MSKKGGCYYRPEPQATGFQTFMALVMLVAFVSVIVFPISYIFSKAREEEEQRMCKCCQSK